MAVETAPIETKTVDAAVTSASEEPTAANVSLEDFVSTRRERREAAAKAEAEKKEGDAPTSEAPEGESGLTTPATKKDADDSQPEAKAEKPKPLPPMIGEADDAPEEDDSEEDEEGASASDDSDEEEDTEGGEESGPKGAKGLQKRVGKLVKQRNSWRERAENAEAELAEARAGGRPPAGADPVAALPEIAELDGRIGQVSALRQWLKANPEGGKLPSGKEIAEGDVANLLEEIQETLPELRAERKAMESQARQRHQQTVALVHEQVAAVAPEVLKKGSPERKLAEAVLKDFPEIRRSPHYELALSWYVLGKAEYDRRVAEYQGAGEPTRSKSGGRKPMEVIPTQRKQQASRTPTQVATGPGGDVPGPDAEQAREVEQLLKNYEESGSSEDYAALRSARRRLNQLRAA